VKHDSYDKNKRGRRRQHLVIFAKNDYEKMGKPFLWEGNRVFGQKEEELTSCYSSAAGVFGIIWKHQAQFESIKLNLNLNHKTVLITDKSQCITTFSFLSKDTLLLKNGEKIDLNNTCAIRI
jgi:hypothetical protein